MKLNICYNDNGHINNYTNVNIINNTLNIKNIVSNSCDEIIISDTLDYIPYENIDKLLSQIIQKIRLNGKLIVIGNDLRCISRLVSSENITVEQFCSIIRETQSMSTEPIIRNILISEGLSIESSLINHHKYEIIAMRKAV